MNSALSLCSAHPVPEAICAPALISFFSKKARLDGQMLAVEEETREGPVFKVARKEERPVPIKLIWSCSNSVLPPMEVVVTTVSALSTDVDEEIPESGSEKPVISMPS